MTIVRDLKYTLGGLILACVSAVTVTYIYNLDSLRAFFVGTLIGGVLVNVGLALDSTR